jgi:hypothetical protein
MSISNATLTTRVFSRLAADLAAPVYSQIDDANITIWADELTPIVSKKLTELGVSGELQALVTIGSTIALSGAGIGSLPSDYETHLTAKVLVGSNRKRLFRLYDNPSKFALWDSTNYVLTPTTRKPVGLIANGQIRIKPTTITTAYLDYVIQHPTIVSNNTKYGKMGDTMLVGAVAGRCFDFLEEVDLGDRARKEVGL